MFNSPAPRLTPRRAPSRLRDSVSHSRGTQSIFSESEVRSRHDTHAPSVSSRLAVPRGQAASPTSSAGDTIRTGRGEVEGYEKVMWARDERFAVGSAGALPREVQAVVKQTDLVANTVRGHLDPISGFAFMTTPTICVAWNYQKRTHSSPTCYTFPAPPTSYADTLSHVPVLASLYSTSVSRSAEPGMILVGPSGEVRFWESMSLALANVERYHTVHLQLTDNDYADHIWRVEANTYIITTISSLAYRLSIASQAGRVIPTVTPLTRPSGMFGRATNVVFPRNDDRTSVTAVASGSGVVYIMAGKTIQKWNISSDIQRFVQEYDLHDTVGNALFDDWGSSTSTLELKDLVTYNTNELATLVSCTEAQSTSYSRSHSFAIAIFNIHSQSHTLMVSRIIHVSHLSHSDPRALDIPRLLIPIGSPIAFIRLADVIVMVSLSLHEEYEDVISLKERGVNAFIGVGCKTIPVTSRKSSGSPLVLMPAVGGLLSVDVFDPLPKPSGTTYSASTASLKSKMEQAVFFGDRSDNPLSFDLSPGFQGKAAEAAEAVSIEILASTSAYAPAVFELKPQLADRLARLEELIAFIRSNGLLSMLSQATRRRLSRDAEKAKAAIELWEYQNRHMELVSNDDQIHSHSAYSLLADSITAYMKQAGHDGDEDVIRGFFRTQAPHLDELLAMVYSTLRTTLSSVSTRNDIADWVVEANRIFITVLRAASVYQETVQNYVVDKLYPEIELWTAQDSLIDALDFLYTATERTVKDRTRDLGSVVDGPSLDVDNPELRRQREVQNMLKTQLGHLAAALCANMEDKIRNQSIRQMNDGANPQEGMALKQRWDEMKPRIIRPLATLDRVSEAYDLAENHSDFPTLVYLCHDPVAGKGSAQIQIYIERFGEEFAFVLYQWYIDQGRLHALMSQDEVYGAYLTKFFDIYGYPELAWMHHIACGRYTEAASSLAVVDGPHAGELAHKRLVTSIAKLAAVTLIKAKGESKQRTDMLNDLDDQLELVGVQNTLRSNLIGGSGASQNNTGAIDQYISANAANLAERPAFRDLFGQFCRLLGNGETLDPEDLIDLLSMKENTGSSVGDPAIALDRLVKDAMLPEGRKSVALVSIWRRVLIRDDWCEIANTSGRSEEAQRELIRNTLAYHTIKAIGDIPDFPTAFILAPIDAAQAPLASELSARFPDWPAQEIECLLRDHEDDVELLNRFMQEANLDTRIKEVAELVKRDQGDEDADEDVFM